MNIEANVRRALDEGRPILLRSLVLKEDSEEILEQTMRMIYALYSAEELAAPIYAAVRELIQNAAKANIKRILFEELGVQVGENGDYREAMDQFRRQLNRTRIVGYFDAVRDRGLYVDIRFEYSPRCVAISVTNPFPLYPEEERRIRQKFASGLEGDGLYDYYLKHSDQVEGAGMGIAMVMILLQQLGFDTRLFTISTDPQNQRSVARILTPMRSDFVSARRRFEEIRRERGCSADELRRDWREGRVELPWL